MNIALRLSLVGIIALVAALAAWSAGQVSAGADERRQLIAAKSQAERDQLRRRFETFRGMSHEEQESVRRLHEAVEANPNLLKTLGDYERFLDELDPWDREELRRKAPGERVAMVEELLAQRTRRENPGRPGWLSGRFAGGTTLHSKEFDQAITLILDSLGLSEQERARVPAGPPHARHLAVMRLAARKSPPARPSRFWPDDPTTTKILSLLPEGRFRSWLLSNEHTSEWRRAAIMSVLSRSLLAEWQFVAAHLVSPDEMRKAVTELPEARQAEWSRRDPDRLIREVIKNVFAKRDDAVGDFARDFGEVVKLWTDYDPFSRERRGPPGRGPGIENRRGPGRDSDGRGRNREDVRRNDGAE